MYATTPSLEALRLLVVKIAVRSQSEGAPMCHLMTTAALS